MGGLRRWRAASVTSTACCRWLGTQVSMLGVRHDRIDGCCCVSGPEHPAVPPGFMSFRHVLLCRRRWRLRLRLWSHAGTLSIRTSAHLLGLSLTSCSAINVDERVDLAFGLFCTMSRLTVHARSLRLAIQTPGCRPSDGHDSLCCRVTWRTTGACTWWPSAAASATRWRGWNSPAHACSRASASSGSAASGADPNCTPDRTPNRDPALLEPYFRPSPHPRI